MAEGVTLADLATAVPGLDPRMWGEPVAITDLRHDSRTVRSGEGFVAIPGATADGHDFAAGAVERGAVALVAERLLEPAVPQLLVADTRRALPMLAATVHGHPSRKLSVVGVTGTNGKTTVAYMLEAIAVAAGRIPGVVGTVGARIAGIPVPVARTTPEATDLQRLLGQMLEDGVDVVALEVSSHALVLGRADVIDYDVVAFTNLSQDHLDFHGSMEEYAAAKARLFDEGRAARAVIWTDDAAGAAIAGRTLLPVTTVGFSSATDVRGDVIELSSRLSVIDVQTPHGEMRMTVPVGGRFNAANALVAAACAIELGIGLDSVAAGLRRMPAVPGRFELVESGQDFTVVVDYAHTPEAVARIVNAARDLTDGRVIAVLGAGGDRDRAKRPEMGAAVATADLAVLTSDNPRSEDPLAIMDGVLAGVQATHRAVLVEEDRAAAIGLAIGDAGTGDVVLILGKGHEQGQEFADTTMPFDDRLVAAAAIEARGSR